MLNQTSSMAGNAVGNIAVNALRAELISYQVGTQSLLDGVSLALSSGQVMGLIGANGAGKSTLLRVLAGLLNPTAGNVWLEGKPLRQFSIRERAQRIAHVQQSAALDVPFTVRDVVAMGRNPHVGRFAVESAHDRAVVEMALRQTQTLDLAERSVTTLSGGERQRVLLARALAQEPRVLLLDEPTSSLDIRHQIEVFVLLRQIVAQHPIAILIAIHDLAQAAQYADQLMVLHDGRVLVTGSPSETLTPATLATAFGVAAQPYPDPYTQALRLSIQLAASPRD